MAVRYPAWQWFDEFERSGLTVTEFCQSIPVCAQTFYRWRNKLGRNPGLTEVSSAESTEMPTFVSVHCPASTVEFKFPGNVVAKVPSDQGALRAIVEVLVDIGASS